VDNIDSKAQGNISMDEFHGYVLIVTNHLSHENHGVKRAPIKLDLTDTSVPKLPNSYVIQAPVVLNKTNVFVLISADDGLKPSFIVDGAKLKEEAWMHLWHVLFFITVLAENPVPEGASATVQELNSLPSVNVRVVVLTGMMVNRNRIFLDRC